MFSRNFFIFCSLALFIAAVSAAAEEPEEPETRDPELSKIVEIIEQAIKWAAKKCLKEVGEYCRGRWSNPQELVECVVEFLETNKGRCARFP